MTSVAHAGHLLERARWAARAYADYDHAAVSAIVTAVADAGYAAAERFAEAAVSETEMGVAEHKVAKNRACSRGVLEHYRGEDLISPRIDTARKIVEIPRPAGVVLAITPTTNPVSTVYFKVMLSLMTRNAVVVAPHPRAKQCSADAARLLADAAVSAGAPDGIVQVVDEPSIPLVEALMADERTDVIVATGGTGVVRAAYSSGNPALGVGPGNVPVFVDASADVNAAARRIVDSKAFDNSVLCTNESVLIAVDAAAGPLLAQLKRCGSVLLDEAGRDRLRDFLFPDGRLNGEAIGKDASWIAARAGLRVPPRTKVLLAPFRLVLPEEPFAREKLSPVLGVVTTASADRGIEAARAVIRIGGAGHSAAIHSQDPRTVLRFAERVPVLRIAVNAGNSTGSAGLDTNLAPSMTLGTGFAGRSSIGENLEPKHLVNWARVAYHSAADVPFGDFTGLATGHPPDGPVPPYPLASNQPGAPGLAPAAAPGPAGGPGGSAGHGSRDTAAGALPDAVREQLRALIIEELSQLIKG